MGDDALGRDILRRFEALGLPAGLVQVDESAPTGTVGVELDADGVPRFTIHGDAAWDLLLATQGRSPPRRRRTPCASAAWGSGGSRRAAASRRWWRPRRPGALRIFDVNLRQPFYSREVLEQSLRLANVLKLNDTELPVLASLFGAGGSPEAQLEGLARRFDLRVVALTRGAQGSLLLGPTGWADHPGLAAEVVDTVGAGDAFTAALALGLLLEWPLDRTNALANEVACHVCGCAGATPSLPPRLAAVFASASPNPSSRPMSGSALAHGRRAARRAAARRVGARVVGCRHGGRRHPVLSRAVSSPVPLHAGPELDERPERARVLRRRVPPVLPVQPLRRPVGPHELGPRGEPRPGPLAAPAARPGGRERRDGLLGQRRRGLEEHAAGSAARAGRRSWPSTRGTTRSGRCRTSTSPTATIAAGRGRSSPATPCWTSGRRTFATRRCSGTRPASAG